VFGAPTGIDLQEGIQRMAQWARRVGARQGQEFSNIEITEKLPQGWNISKEEPATA
jgi:UDP-glucose 4-epimerase